MIVLFNKPFRVLSQFTTEGDKSVLADYIDVPGVYCAGRLDYDSEGLLVLTDDGKLQQRISNPAGRASRASRSSALCLPMRGPHLAKIRPV